MALLYNFMSIFEALPVHIYVLSCIHSTYIASAMELTVAFIFLWPYNQVVERRFTATSSFLQTRRMRNDLNNTLLRSGDIVWLRGSADEILRAF